VYLMGHACRQGIEFSCVPYKLSEGAECAFPQVDLAILPLALFAPMIRHTYRPGNSSKHFLEVMTSPS
jgi:hypothetical protein